MMNKWFIIFFKKKEKEKNISRAFYFRLGLPPSTWAPSTFLHGPRPSFEPNCHGSRLHLILGYFMTLGVVIFDKTFSDGLLSSYKNCLNHQKFTTVNRLLPLDNLWRNLLPLCDTRNDVVINTFGSHNFMTTHNFSSYYVTLYDENRPRHEGFCHKKKNFL